MHTYLHVLEIPGQRSLEGRGPRGPRRARHDLATKQQQQATLITLTL